MKRLFVCLFKGKVVYNVLAIAALTALLASMAAIAQASEEVNGGAASQLVWQENLTDGLASARKKGKLVLVDLFTDWCGWCKKLDRETYTDPSVVEFVNSHFVCVKLNGEDKGAGQSFAKENKVRGYPCIIVLETDGKVRATHYGYRNPSDFLELIKVDWNEPQH